jgi:Flp pilus assembly pilin Flp
MNLIVIWIMRLCELRDAIARGQIAGSQLIPNFLSSLRIRREGDDELGDTTRAEYALIVVILAVIVVAGYHALSSGGLFSLM